MQTTMRDFYTAIRSRLPAHQTHNNVTGKSNPGHFPLPPTTSPPPRGFNGTRAGHSYWYRLSDFFIHSSGALLGDKPNQLCVQWKRKAPLCSNPVFKPCVTIGQQPIPYPPEKALCLRHLTLRRPPRCARNSEELWRFNFSFI